ncbi:hypothetical protein Taro_052758 [Colocasia esculenta]|uniref:Uncharacterized protein n=1 Tax=Colocasia esculenta TaxID=4460 RepID=A0A843XJ79_COLES|nr:hypothetical protein [Colocasia esculenta]
MEEDNAREAQKAAIWDCGSSLYDSFELEALKRQLTSTIISRSYSMPHLSDPAPAPQRPPRKPSKISRSVHGLLRAVFRVGPGAAAPDASPPPPPHGCVHMGLGYRGVRPHASVDGGVAEASASGKKGAVAAVEQLRPEVRKTASERFTRTVPVVSRISCH